MYGFSETLWNFHFYWWLSWKKSGQSAENILYCLILIFSFCPLPPYIKMASFHHSIVRPQVADGKDGLQIWSVTGNMERSELYIQFNIRNICVNNLLRIHIWYMQKGMVGTHVELDKCSKCPPLVCWNFWVRRINARETVAKMFTGIGPHDVSISSHNVSSVGGFPLYTASFRDPQK
jgi:hypothetical protein